MNVHLIQVSYFVAAVLFILSLRWLNHPRFQIIEWDVILPIFMDVDQIYHLACPASPIYYQKDPVFTIKTNVMGTLNMLGLATRNKARILLASTSEVSVLKCIIIFQMR